MLATALLLPAMVWRLAHLGLAANLGDGLALDDQLLRRFELADDLLGCAVDSFHCEVPSPVWPFATLIRLVRLLGRKPLMLIVSPKSNYENI